MMAQARNQSEAARQLGLPVSWHVADANVAEFLRREFAQRKWNNIAVHATAPAR